MLWKKPTTTVTPQKHIHATMICFGTEADDSGNLALAAYTMHVHVHARLYWARSSASSALRIRCARGGEWKAKVSSLPEVDKVEVRK